MNKKRVCFLKCLICILMTTCLVLGINTESFSSDIYPSKPIKIVVGYAAGGVVDLALRAYAPSLEKILGQPVIMEYKPGAAGAIMMNFVKSSPPDGYTLAGFANGVITGSHIREVAYHFFDDFTQISQLYDVTATLTVKADAPWKTAKDLIEYAKNNPGKLLFGNPGIGGASHLVMEQFAFRNNIKYVSVPCDGDAALANLLLAGNVDLSTSSVPTTAALIAAGRLRLLAMISPERVKAFPDVPTMKEQGLLPNTYTFSMGGILGPKNLPANIVEKLASAIKVAANDPNTLKITESIHMNAIARSGQEWINFLKEGDAQDYETLKRANIKIVREAYKDGGKPVR